MKRILSLVTVIGWTACFALLGLPWIVFAFGVVGVSSLLLLWLGGASFRALFRWRWRPILIGLGVGVVMTVATYPAFELTKSLLPVVPIRVTQLYQTALPSMPALGLVALVVAVIGEEIIWRGAVADLLLPQMSRPTAGAIACLLYAVSPAIFGQWLVAVMSIVMGGIWMFLRLTTGSLWAPLLCHLVWSVTVLGLAPVK